MYTHLSEVEQTLADGQSEATLGGVAIEGRPKGGSGPGVGESVGPGGHPHVATHHPGQHGYT